MIPPSDPEENKPYIPAPPSQSRGPDALPRAKQLPRMCPITIPETSVDIV